MTSSYIVENEVKLILGAIGQQDWLMTRELGIFHIIL